MIVVGVSYCVLIVFFPFCDARHKRYLGDIGKDLLEKNQSLFLWSVRRSPWTLCWKQASYFTELAFIYIYFDHLKYSKSSDDVLKTFLQKTWKLFWHPIWRYWMENSFFSNYRMGNIWFIPNSFLKYRDECDMPNCRYGSGEMMNGDVYEKLHIVS